MAPYQVVRSKMSKLSALLQDPELAPYIPETVFNSSENLERMLKDYSLVYVKPDKGRGGERVIAVQLNKAGHYRVHYKTHIQDNMSFDAVKSFIAAVMQNKKSIVQQGIKLMRIKNTPIDLRVHIQKPYKKWEATGFLVKIAAPGKIVTNRHSGGTLVNFKEGLAKAGLKKRKIVKLTDKLIYLGERAAATLNKKYSGLRELGVDFALDKEGRPWILEVNTRPQFPKGDKRIDQYHKIIVKK